jgi:hypothetical protein
MSANPSLSLAFLTDLAEVHASLQPQPQGLSRTFLSDLAQVHSLLPAAPGVDLQFLAKSFDTWRQWVQEQIRLSLQRLDPDDPLLCPISLFGTMDYGRLETAHTRTLAWLVNPKAEHGFGEKLLATLLQRLTRRDRIDTLSAEHVTSEYPIAGADEKGRLDVLAEGTWDEDGKQVRWVLVIEAKVDAWEGETQLEKYEQWLSPYAAERRVDRLLRVFLTPDGRAAESGADEWEPLSYPDLVRTFRPGYAELRDSAGFHFLRFYLAGVLQDICGCPRRTAEDAPNPYVVLDYLK